MENFFDAPNIGTARRGGTRTPSGFTDIVSAPMDVPVNIVEDFCDRREPQVLEARKSQWALILDTGSQQRNSIKDSVSGSLDVDVKRSILQLISLGLSGLSVKASSLRLW